MAVRGFDGVDDCIVLGGDGAALTNWGVMAVVKMLSTSGDRAIVSAGITGTTTIGALFLNAPTLTQQNFGSTAGDSGATISWNRTDWWLLGFTKSTGTTARFHAANLTTGAAANHVDSTGWSGDTAGNWSATHISRFPDSGTGFGNMRLATAAVLDTVYTDGNFNTVAAAKTTASIAALAVAGDRVWDFNQASEGTAVVDLISGTPDELSRVETTVVGGDDPPGWVFGTGSAGSPVALTSAREFPAARFGP